MLKREIGYFAPPQPARWMKPMRGRAKRRHIADLFVAPDRLIDRTGCDAERDIEQWNGA
ncbi:MAG TPA: hypothetical protein VND19_18170 [Acetobacteraceae bacterium]|nr:hypothetical protein [Acetobacteraceae bacterium]